MQTTTHQRLVEEEDEDNKYNINNKNKNNDNGEHSYSQVHAHAYAGDAHAARAWTQLFVFGRKNATLAFRNWKGSLGQLLSPVVIVVLLFGLQQLGNSILDADKPSPIPTPIGHIYPHCHERFVSCKSIIYAPSNVPWVTTLMQTVAEKSKLDFNETFTGIENDATGIAQFQNDNSTIYNYLLANPNRTQHAIIFTSAYVPFNDPFNSEAPMQDVGYILFYNNTLVDSYSLQLMRIVDESVILLKGSANASINAQLNTFPVPPSRISGYDAVAANGGIWFYVPSMITFFILLTEIVMEKENRLRLGMRMMGLMDSVYWTIYFFTGMIFIALTTLVLIGVGAAFQFDFFLKSNFFAVFLMFFCFGLATNALAFLLSTLVGTSKTAQTMGYAIILVGFVFQIILCSGYGFLVDMLYLEDLATWVIVVRWILTFYPPYNLALAFNNIASYSSNIINISAGTITPGQGYFWHTLYEKRTSEQFGMVMNIPSNSFIYLMLLMNAGLFLILALYLDNVIPGEHGAPKPFYFFLTKSYWGFGKKKKAKEDILSTSSSVVSTDVDVQQETKKAADTLIAKSDKGVQVLNLCKTYPSSIFHKSDKDVKAVDNLSLCAEEGDILCILGHNGAGKTTTINMLVGLFPPTSGIAMVYGKDVTQEMAQIQRYMGVCPQHDILWNELTAREHLLIFAQLKGVPKKAVDREILDKLGMVGLAKNSNDRVGTFSGGMKRRLSVAIAAIGEPKIIFLDEPTTGMDPVNRRSVWELIQKMKEGRVIILTTHSMEEADMLGDKISIMAHGNLCAVGNSLHLKNRFGIGYRVNVTVSEMKNKRLVTTEIKNIAPEAVLLASNAGNLTFGIPLACRDKMELVLKYLEQKSGEEVLQHSSAYFSTNATTHKPIVKEWGLSHTSLEDVFLEVTKRENFTYPEDGHKEQDDHVVPYDMEMVASEKDMAKEIKKSRKGSAALRALIRKNFSLQKRQTGTNCCQIVTPILVMVILVLLQVIVRTQIKNLDTTTKVNTFPWPLNVDLNDLNTSVLFSSSSLSSLSSPSSLSPSSSPLSLFDVETGYEIVDDSIRQYLDEIMNPITGKPAENFLEIFSRASKPAPRFSTFSKNSKNSKISNEQAVFPHKYRNDSNCLEFFYFTKPNSDIDSATIGNLPATNDTTKSGLLAYITQKTCVLYNETEVNVPYFEQWPDAKSEQQSLFTILESYNKISLEDLDKAPYNYPLPDGTADFTSANPDGSISYVIAVNDNPITRYHRKNNFTRLDLNETDQYAQNGATLIVSTAQLSLMSMINDAYTQYVTNFTYSILSTKFVQLMPYTSHYDIVGLLEIFGSFLYPIALALQLPVYLYILVLEKAEKIREMMSMHGLPKWTYYLSHYIFCFILFVVVIAFFYIVGAVAHIRMFRETNFFVLSLFFFAWGNSLISMSMLFSTFISSKRVSVVVGYLVALLGSLIAIVIAIGIYNDTSRHMPIAYFIWPQFAFVRGIYLLNNACTTNYACYSLPVPRGDEYISCVVALFICSIIYYIMPREFGVPKHPLFFLRPILPKSFFEKHKEDKDKESTSLLAKEKEKGFRQAKTFRDNTDVEHEKNRVTRKEYASNAPLVIDDLAKKYPGAEKYSLASLHLAVESGECFSLLGENGAGKSTSISLLTGLYPPTRGTARIAGHDINNEMSLARLALGVCPQFNVLWDTLTVEEHLLFYARLKGVPTKEEKEHVSMWLNELGLSFASSRASSSLSGGMKRRLSVGIALVGDPKVVFLDEPTTGLDPASRRQLWTILERARPGRAIILTTHSMDEAEVLSNRIGIMALGSLRCIGTPHHLKNLVGNLFHLKINFVEHNLKLAEDFVYSIFPKASLIRTYKGTSEFHISQDGVLVSEVFAKMEASSSENGIIDWSFSQVGLEEVFQMVVEESHAHHNK